MTGPYEKGDPDVVSRYHWPKKDAHKRISLSCT